MALTLGDILTAARDRHPLFHPTRVPDAVGARHLTGYQRQLIAQIADFDDALVAQQASILFDLNAANAVGTAGAGTAGGLPASAASGQPVEAEIPAGSAVEMDFDNAPVLVSQFPVGAATATTLTKTGATWTTNFYANKYVWISGGPGIGQGRLILSNTATVLTLQGAWTTLPTAGISLAEIVQPALALPADLGAIVQVPAEAERVGYLVRLDANGLPYVDLTKPLTAKFAVGIDLPPLEYLMGGEVHVAEQNASYDLGLTTYQQRWTSGAQRYSAYRMGGQLYLIGDEATWNGVTSIDLRYVPIAPALTSLADYFLLPDTAYSCLVAAAAATMAYRVNALPGANQSVDAESLSAEAGAAEGTFLNSIGRTARSNAKFVRSVW